MHLQRICALYIKKDVWCNALHIIAKPVLLIFVVCYFVILVGMGIYCSKEAKNSEDFILAGKGLGPVSFSLCLPWARLSYCLLCPGRSEKQGFIHWQSCFRRNMEILPMWFPAVSLLLQ